MRDKIIYILFDYFCYLLYNTHDMKRGKKLKYNTIIPYTNLQQDVVDFNISPIKIDEKYVYIHRNPFYRFFSFLTYWLIAKPVACLHYKLHGYKIVNRKLLKSVKGGYFIYGNHTAQILDAFGPTHIIKGKNPQVICNAQNVSNGLVGRLIRMWGAIPLPDTIAATRNFNARIDWAIKKSQPVLIYPEAHLWPYHTKIRPFDDASFHYPVKYKKPIFTFTTTYQLKKPGKKPRIVLYVDGPFYSDETLPAKQQREQLRNWAYETMCKRSLNSNYEYIKYQYKPSDSTESKNVDKSDNTKLNKTNKTNKSISTTKTNITNINDERSI